MLDGFGQAPVCLELDLDSYDGPWTHVERFRGRSGWLVVAEARVSTAGAGWTTALIAACDEYGEPVPSFMAPNLLACACSHPRPCCDYPPEELEDLLDHAAHELRLGWLRENNAGLRDLSHTVAERVATLEAATRAAVEKADRRVADLRRRRRMPGVSPHAIAVFNEAITAVELDRETALHHLSEQRARLRRATAAEELALLRRTSVTVEWEPLYHISWSAAGRDDDDDLAARDHVASARYRAAAFAHNERQGRREDGIAASLLLSGRLGQATPDHGKQPAEPAPPSVAAAGVGRPTAQSAIDPCEAHQKLLKRIKTLAGQVDALHSNRLPIARGYLIRLIALRRDVAVLMSALADGDPALDAKRVILADAGKRLSRVETILAAQHSRSPTAGSTGVAPAPAVPASPGQTAAAAAAIVVVVPMSPPVAVLPVVEMPTAKVVTSSPPPLANAKLKLERDMLARQLAALETTGRKFLRGSPKFERNLAQWADIAERIRELDVSITGPDRVVAAAPSLEDQRADLEAELRRHQQRGAKPSDGIDPYGQYRDRRLSLLGRIAELNVRIERRARRERQA